MHAPSRLAGNRRVSLPALALASFALVVGSVAAIRLAADAYSPPMWMAVEYGLTFLLPTVLIYGAYWLATGEFTPEELWRTVWWTVGGVVTLAVVAGLILLHRHFEGGKLIEPIFLVAVLSLIGGVVGFATAVTHLHETRVVESSLGSTRTDDRVQSNSHSRVWPEDDAATSSHSAGTPGPEIFQPRSREDSLDRQWMTLEAVAACGDCSIEELATMLAQNPSNSFSNDPERVAIELYHRYLPMVAESGLIQFDSTTRFVTYTGPETLVG